MPLSEKELIRRISQMAKSRLAAGGGAVHLGIGDDCAVLRPKAGQEVLVTTDLSLEGTHFRRDWHSAEAIGHRCLCRGLSDIAAMGAEPVAAFLSLGLPGNLWQQWVNGFLDGFIRLARRTGTRLAGGDIAQSRSGIAADVMVVGTAPKGRAILRSGSRPGDILYVTGTLGGSAATLRRLSADETLRSKTRLAPYRNHFFPEPRLAIGRFLRENRLATAMIDVSDGLSTDLAHICAASGVGAVVNQSLLPVARGAALNDALHGGEDYELLFTAKKSARVPVEIGGVPVTEIGWVTSEKKLLISDLKTKPRNLRVRGWEHFRKENG